MSHALPAPLYDVDTKRILATAATIAVHLLALMLMLAPVEWVPPVATVTPPTVVVFTPPKPLPPIPPPPQPIREARPVTQAPPLRVAVPDAPPVISHEPNPMAIPYVPVEVPPVITAFNPPPTGPVALAVIESPAPVYPISAIRMGVTGRVILRIEVDANGRAVSGVIEQSSGSKLLDNAALRVVLAKWRFVPAQHAGQNIAATALVPIVFSLD